MMVSVKEKDSKLRGGQEVSGICTLVGISTRMIGKRLRKVIFEQCPQRSEGSSHQHGLGGSILCKGFGVGKCTKLQVSARILGATSKWGIMEKG